MKKLLIYLMISLFLVHLSFANEIVDPIQANTELNYGESLGDISNNLGETDTTFLANNTFQNGISDENYIQTLQVLNGEYNYALKDSVDGVDTIREGIFFEDGDSYAIYSLNLDHFLPLDTLNVEDFIGEELNIMNKEFVITDIKADGSNNLNELSLIGGENKISLGEGESFDIFYDGFEYNIKILSVDPDKVLISVNNQLKYINEYEFEIVAGIRVGVLNLVYSSRESVKGYAELIIGANIITLKDGATGVKINSEDLSDIFENYEVYSDFIGSGFDEIQIVYKVDDDILLENGDSLKDVLFQAFKLNFNGNNNPDYSTLELRVNDDDLELSGITSEGEDFHENLLHLGDKTNSNSAVWVAGDNDEDRMIFSGSKDLTNAVGTSNLNYVDGVDGTLNLTNNNVKGLRFLMEVDLDEQYLYEITSIDTTGDNEVDFDELLNNEPEEDIKRTEWNSKLGQVSTFITDTTADNFVFDTSTFGDTIAFENEILVELANAESVNLTALAPYITLGLDSNDINEDNVNDGADAIKISLDRDIVDQEFDIEQPSVINGHTIFQNIGEADNIDGDSDVRTFVTAYGIKVEYDNDEKRSIKIEVPDEQVKANVNLEFGNFSFEGNYISLESNNFDYYEKETISIIDSNKELNYGENINDVASSALDSADTVFLRDRFFENGLETKEYSQTLRFSNGEYNYALRDSVTGINSIQEGIFYTSNETFAIYSLELDSALDLTNLNRDDFVGESLIIMNKEYVISDIVKDGSNNLNELSLIGGNQRISLGEGEITTVQINGDNFEVEVLSVDSDKVLVQINNQTRAIDIFDVDNVAGVRVGVTDLLDSNIESVRGYAELVIGANLIVLTDSNSIVDFNGEPINNTYNDYIVYSNFIGSGFDEIQIMYNVKDDYLLLENESLNDILFEDFKLNFEGNNNPEFQRIDLNVNDDQISIEGELSNGEMFNKNFIYSTTTDGTDGITYFKGDNDEDRIFFQGSVYLGTQVDLVDNNILQLNFTDNEIKGSGFFLYDDLDEQFLYEIKNIDTLDKEIDLEELFSGREETELGLDELGTQLEVPFFTSNNLDIVNVSLGLEFKPELSFANELVMDFSQLEDDLGIDDSLLIFKLDESDIFTDYSTDGNESYEISFSWDNPDNEFNINLDKLDNDFVNLGNTFNIKGDSDVQTFVTKYGTKVQYNDDEKDQIRIIVPDEQVSANVNVVFGNLNNVSIQNSQDDSSNSKFEFIESFVVGFDSISGKYYVDIDVKASSFYESVALYIEDGNEWYSLCEFERKYINGVESFSCDGEVPFTFKDGDYALRASTNYCGGVYSSNPQQNCGDYQDKYITLNRGISQDNGLVILSGYAGFGISNPQRTVHIKDTLRLEPRSTAPSSPSLGDLYVDSDSNELCFYDGSSWTGIKAGGICS